MGLDTSYDNISEVLSLKVLKYEIPAIRNSDFLTGNHTCIFKYLYFPSLKATFPILSLAAYVQFLRYMDRIL